MPRFFVEENLKDESEIWIRKENARHLIDVLRVKSAEKIELCDNNEVEYNCVVVEVRKEELLLRILSSQEGNREPRTRISLFQGLPKSDKLELIIQKCVELGVYEIIPVSMARSVVKLNEGHKADKKIERWQNISLSAAKQSGRGIIPQIRPLMNIKEALEYAKGLDAVVLPYEKEDSLGIKEFLRENIAIRTLGIFIGPEGGFEQSEVEWAQECGVKSVTLGSRILRTETAAMMAIGISIYELG